MVRPFITDELREEVLRQSGREALPEVAEQIDDINEVRGICDSVANAIKNEIRKAAPGAIKLAAPRIA